MLAHLLGTTLDPPTFRSFFVTWSYGRELDMDLLELWLQRIDVQYVQPGLAKWASFRDVYEAFVEQRDLLGPMPTKP